MSTMSTTRRNAAHAERPFAARKLQDAASDAVILRPARPSDAVALRRLAQLDDAAPLTGETLLAEQDGELRAALSLRTGRVIADPFRRTTDLVALLEVRAELLLRERRPARPVLSLLRRVTRASGAH